jgi:hypothetical protein
MMVGEGATVSSTGVKVAGGEVPGGERGSAGRLGGTKLPGAGDWTGRLAAGSLGDKKTVETMVTVTRSPAGGSVASGMPPEVREGSVDMVGSGIPVFMLSAGGVEEGPREGLTAVGIPGVPLERVTLG